MLKFGYDGLGNRMVVNDRVFIPDHADPFAYIDPLGLCAQGSDWTRVEGFFQMIGGGAEAAAGTAFAIGTAETGVGIAAGAAVAIHGADVASAGAYKLWYGMERDTLTSQGLQAVGVPRDWANGVDAGISIVGSVGVGVAARAASQSTTLYRAVQQPELLDIQASGKLRIPDAYRGISAEGKYFTTSREHAEKYANAAMKAFSSDLPYSII